MHALFGIAIALSSILFYSHAQEIEFDRLPEIPLDAEIRGQLLDLNEKDPITKIEFQELIDKCGAGGIPFVLALTAIQEGNVYRYRYYHANIFNNFIFGEDYTLNTEQYAYENIRDIVSQCPLAADIQYYLMFVNDAQPLLLTTGQEISQKNQISSLFREIIQASSMSALISYGLARMDDAETRAAMLSAYGSLGYCLEDKAWDIAKIWYKKAAAHELTEHDTAKARANVVYARERLGSGYKKQGNLQEARFWYEKAVEVELTDNDLDYGHAAACSSYISLFHLTESQEEKKRLMHKIIERNVELAGEQTIKFILDAYNRLGILYEKEDPATAHNWYEKVLQYDINQYDNTKYKSEIFFAHIKLAHIARKNKNIELAKTLYNKVLTESLEDDSFPQTRACMVAAWFGLARISNDEGYHVKARKYYYKVAQVQPLKTDQPPARKAIIKARFALGALFKQKGNYQESRRWYARVVDYQPYDDDIAPLRYLQHEAGRRLARLG